MPRQLPERSAGFPRQKRTSGASCSGVSSFPLFEKRCFSIGLSFPGYASEKILTQKPPPASKDSTMLSACTKASSMTRRASAGFFQSTGTRPVSGKAPPRRILSVTSCLEGVWKLMEPSASRAMTASSTSRGDG